MAPEPLDDSKDFVQYGVPHSASTFQFVLLCLAVRLKHLDREVPCGYKDQIWDVRPLEVIKTHRIPSVEREQYHLFASLTSENSSTSSMASRSSWSISGK